MAFAPPEHARKSAVGPNDGGSGQSLLRPTRARPWPKQASWPSRLWPTAALLLALLHCARSGPPDAVAAPAVWLSEVHYLGNTAGREDRQTGLSEARGREIITAALAQSPHLVVGEGARPTRRRGTEAWQLTAWLRPDPDALEGLQLALACQATGRSRPLHLWVPVAADTEPAVAAAAQQAGRLLLALRGLEDAGAAAWQAALAPPAPTAVLAWTAELLPNTVGPVRAGALPPALVQQGARALAQLGEHAVLCMRSAPPAEAAPLLRGVLERAVQGPAGDDWGLDDALSLRAVGGLVALGDAAAVAPIIDLGLRREPAFLRPIVYAVGTLGGPLAEAYLLTLAGGHPDEGVRLAAAQALVEAQ